MISKVMNIIKLRRTMQITAVETLRCRMITHSPELEAAMCKGESASHMSEESWRPWLDRKHGKEIQTLNKFEPVQTHRTKQCSIKGLQVKLAVKRVVWRWEIFQEEALRRRRVGHDCKPYKYHATVTVRATCTHKGTSSSRDNVKY